MGDRDFKFGVPIDRQAYKVTNQKCKSRSKGRGVRHVTYFLKFWDPLHISGMGAARDFKFRVPIDQGPTNQEMQN